MSELTHEKATLEIDEAEQPSREAREKALDALAFVESLHQAFKDTGMTTSTEPDLNELENLIDALHGELGAAVLFLCEPSFARVPDMLRAIGKAMTGMEEASVVPTPVVKGFARLAKRIENTRQNQQQMARVSTTASDSP